MPSPPPGANYTVNGVTGAPLPPPGGAPRPPIPPIGPGGFSGGGWTPQQWDDYIQAQNAATTPEERQRLTNTRPDVAQALNSPQAQAIHAADGGAYFYGGDPGLAQKLAGGAFLQSGAMGNRAAPQADFTGSQNDLNAGRAGLLAGAGRLGQAYQVGEQQQGLANQLGDVIAGNGPSVAQLAMQRASADAANRNLASAAGVGGAGSVAALINAQNQNSVAQGQLQQNLGIQRAAEIAQARGQLGDVLSGIRGQTAAEAGAYAQIGQITGQQQLGNAALQAGQNALNQQGEQFYYGQGADWIKGQAGLNAQRAANWNNFYLGKESNANQANIAQQQHNDAMTGALLSGAATVGAGVATALTGGAAAPALAATIPGTVNAGAKALATNGTGLSDIRAKTAIAPAEGEISGAFRGLGRAADAIRGTSVAYPNLSGSSYFYRNPNAPGAEPGQHYGPMAQELEQTPAGASVVRQMPDGTKGIDTGRLALLNASETAQLRRELDALKGKSGKTAKRVRSTEVAYPELRQPSYFYGQ